MGPRPFFENHRGVVTVTVYDESRRAFVERALPSPDTDAGACLGRKPAQRSGDPMTAARCEAI